MYVWKQIKRRRKSHISHTVLGSQIKLFILFPMRLEISFLISLFMKKLIIFLIFSFFISTNLFAKTLEEKKDELKKIYEAGGISKVEYKKAIEFLENPKEEEKKKKKQAFSLKSKKKKKNKNKDKDEEEITLKKIDDLGVPVKFDKSYYPESMKPKFKGQINSFKGIGGKAGQSLFKSFNRSKGYQQRNPGELIQAMAMYEVFYASQLWNARNNIKRYKENKYTGSFLSRKKEDEKKIRSLFGMNKGQKSMREALGMNSETPAKVAIKKFWTLGEFLDLGTGVKNKKLSRDLKRRQQLLADYKQQISKLKNKLKDDEEDEENEKSVE